jgi:peptidyl-prolyl cis-trans isomerase D
MINKMREMAPIIMLVILVAFVGGTIFLDWGMNLTNRGSRSMLAGKINGREIPLSYFDQQVNIQRQQLQQANKEVPPEQYRMIPKKVWEQEVNRRLMQAISRQLNLDATGEEVFSYIKNNPPAGIDTVSAFQTNGRYDTSKYIQFLNDPNNYNQYRWLHDIESQVANNIIPMLKMEQLLSAAAMPSPAEIRFQYEKKNRKVVFEYLQAEASKFKIDSSAITPAMVTKYYDSYRDTFKVKEQADIYYVKFPKTITDFDEKVYRDELIEMKDRILKSDKPLAEAFSEEATLESDDPGSAQRGGGGDLGWFKSGTMVGAFDSVAFSLPVGTISDPVKTSFGLHLIYVEARETRDSVLQVHARHILRKISPTMETVDLLAERVDSLRIQMLDKGFVAAAKEDKSVLLDSTGLFEKGEQIPGIGYLSGAGQFIFKKSDQPISERLENTDALYLISVKRRTAPGYLSLEDAKGKIRSKLTDSLKIAAAKKYLDALRVSLKDSSSIAKYSTVDSTVTSGVTDTVTGSEYVPPLGYSSPVTAKAFAVPVGTLSPVIETEQSCFIIKPLWKNQIDSVPQLTAPEMQQIASQLKQQTSQVIYYTWYLNYKNKSKIKSNIEDIYIE